MATLTHKLTDEPVDIADALSLTAGTTYAMQFQVVKYAYVSVQASADDVNQSVAVMVGPSQWLKVTPASGEGVYAWSPRGGAVRVSAEIEPY